MTAGRDAASGDVYCLRVRGEMRHDQARVLRPKLPDLANPHLVADQFEIRRIYDKTSPPTLQRYQSNPHSCFFDFTAKHRFVE